MNKISTERLIQLIYQWGPAPSLIAARIDHRPEVIKQVIERNPTLREVYLLQVQRVCEAIHIHGVDRTACARALGVSRSRFVTWVEENTATREAWQDARGLYMDLAQRNLLRGLQGEQRWATEMVLLKSVQGAEEGFGDRITHNLEHEAAHLGVDWRLIRDTIASAIVRGVIDERQVGGEDADGADIDLVALPVADHAPGGGAETLDHL